MVMDAMIGLLEAISSPLRTFIIKVIAMFIEFIVSIIHGAISVLFSFFAGEFLISEDMFKNSLVNFMLQWSEDTMVKIGIALMLLIAMWQVFKTFFSFANLNSEIEEPWKIGLKVMVFSFLIYYSVEICKYLVANPISKVMKLIFNTNIDISKGKISGVTYGMDIYEIINPANYLSLNNKNLFVVVVSAILIVYIDWQMLKFMFQIAQKYVNMVIYIAISPVAFAFGVSRATSEIFKSWTRLFAGGVAIQAIQILVLQLINVYSRLLTTSTSKNLSLFFIYVALGMIMNKIEEILKELGLPSGPKFKIAIDGILKDIWDLILTIKTIRKLFKGKKE